VRPANDSLSRTLGGSGVNLSHGLATDVALPRTWPWRECAILTRVNEAPPRAAPGAGAPATRGQTRSQLGTRGWGLRGPLV
jgi:hypothetical protein